MKLLTLALPVYNGQGCIGASLSSIQDALSVLSKEQQELIEIVVSDNNSTDATSLEIMNFTKHLPALRYNKNEKNLGYDGNIDLLVELSTAKYVWFLGCGEVLKKDALQRVVQKLQTDTEYTNILLDFDIYDERKNSITQLRVFDFEEDISLESKNDFTYIRYALAVSSNIVNKKMWLRVNSEQLVVDGWCHIERILSMIALNEKSKTLFLSKPYFTLFREKNGWWTKPSSYKLLLLHVKVIRSMKGKGYSLHVIQDLEKKQSRFALLMAIIQSKEFGMSLNREVMKDMITLFQNDWFFWLVAFPLLVTPKVLMFLPRGVFKTLQTVKRKLR